jgi:hypothetical protein
VRGIEDDRGASPRHVGDDLIHRAAVVSFGLRVVIYRAMTAIFADHGMFNWLVDLAPALARSRTWRLMIERERDFETDQKERIDVPRSVLFAPESA